MASLSLSRPTLRLSCSLSLAIQHASIASFLCQDVAGDMLEALRCRPAGSVGRSLFGFRFKAFFKLFLVRAFILCLCRRRPRDTRAALGSDEEIAFPAANAPGQLRLRIGSSGLRFAFRSRRSYLK